MSCDFYSPDRTTAVLSLSTACAWRCSAALAFVVKKFLPLRRDFSTHMYLCTQLLKASRGQRTSCGNQFSLSDIWVLGLSGLVASAST